MITKKTKGKRASLLYRRFDPSIELCTIKNRSQKQAWEKRRRGLKNAKSKTNKRSVRRLFVGIQWVLWWIECKGYGRRGEVVGTRPTSIFFFFCFENLATEQGDHFHPVFCLVNLPGTLNGKQNEEIKTVICSCLSSLICCFCCCCFLTYRHLKRRVIGESSENNKRASRPGEFEFCR